jgi:hypothetical protein
VSRPEPPPAQPPDPQAQRDPAAQPDLGAQRDPAAQRPPSAVPAPRQEPAPPVLSFEDEIRVTVRYEKGLAVKALLSIALVAAVLAFRVYFFG